MNGKNTTNEVKELFKNKLNSIFFNSDAKYEKEHLFQKEKFFLKLIRNNSLIHYFSPFCIRNTDSTYKIIDKFEVEDLINLFNCDFKFKEKYLIPILSKEELLLKSAITSEIYEEFKANNKENDFENLKIEDLFTNNTNELNKIFYLDLDKEFDINSLSLRKHYDKRFADAIQLTTFGGIIYLFINLNKNIQINIIKKHFSLFDNAFSSKKFNDDEIISFFILLYDVIRQLRNSAEHLSSIFDFHWEKIYGLEDIISKTTNTKKILNNHLSLINRLPANSANKINNTLMQDKKMTDFFISIFNIDKLSDIYYENNDCIKFSFIDLFVYLSLNERTITYENYKPTKNEIQNIAYLVEKHFNLSKIFQKEYLKNFRNNLKEELYQF